MESGDWRDQLTPCSRQRIVSKIMDTLKTSRKLSGHDDLPELKKIAVRLEEKIYITATSQSDYLQKISSKMQLMETRSKSLVSNPMHPNSAAKCINPSDPVMPQVNNQGQQLPISVPIHHTQPRHQIMNMSNRSPTQGANGVVGDSIDSGDWRALLQVDSRQRIVNKIMNTMKRLLPFSGHEGLQELKKIAESFEEKIYTDATSQSDYLRKISLKMLADAMQANSAANSINPSDPGSQVMPQVNNQGQQLPISVPSNQAQPGQQMMSQSMHSNISSSRIQGSSGLSSALPTGSGVPQSTMANVAGQNPNLQNTQNMSGIQQGSVGNAMGPNSFANQRQILGRKQQRPMPKASSTSLDLTAQTGNPNGGDWQEEVYEKIKAMKDLYLLDLNDMHQKILGKLQQQPKNEQLEKLKTFKNMLELFMRFLQIPKHNILANHKDKLGTYERQIAFVSNSNRRKPAPTQQKQQALPPPHMHSMQQSLSQLTQVQSHDYQMNLQGSMASMQQNNMGSLQQNYVPLMSGGSNSQQNMMNSLQPSSKLTQVQSGDWKAQLPADSRPQIVNQIRDSLKRHLPYDGDEGLRKLKKLAQRLEQFILLQQASLTIREDILEDTDLSTRPQNPMPDMQ